MIYVKVRWYFKRYYVVKYKFAWWHPFYHTLKHYYCPSASMNPTSILSNREIYDGYDAALKVAVTLTREVVETHLRESKAHAEYMLHHIMTERMLAEEQLRAKGIVLKP
jgi:hypothetical protein